MELSRELHLTLPLAAVVLQLKKLRNNLWRSGTEGGPNTKTLTMLDEVSKTWQRLEWATLKRLFEEDSARFGVLNYLSHDHLVRLRLSLTIFTLFSLFSSLFSCLSRLR